jgi:glycosyltransferase involved in cell wall biosynthesis
MSPAMAPIRLVVDLSHLLPGGANGGVKPFILEVLGWLGRQTSMPLHFTFLTRSRTHAEVRDRIARVEDEVVCVCDDGDGTLPRAISRVPRERVWLKPPADLAWRLRGDVLYCPFGPPDFACPGIPTICVVVDVLHRDFPAGLPGREIAHREEYFQKLVAAADAIQCITHYGLSRMQAHYAVPAERMFVTHLAIHHRLDARVAADEAARAKQSVFFYPANAWPHKNHEVLLLAYRIYLRRSLAGGKKPWRLGLTGHADQRWDDLRSLAATLDLTGAVDFHGFVDAASLSGLWRSAGALVFPSLHEGFGIPLLEAMHSQTPIVASRATSLPEVGGAACLFVDARRPEDLADAMERVANDPALRQDLAARGAERLQDFGWSREMARLLDRIKALAGGEAWHPSTLGIRDDGWIADAALIGLPRLDERCQLEIVTESIARPRLFTLSAGEVALGSFEPRRRERERIALHLYPNGRSLRVAVEAGGRWSTARSRRQGARLAAARLHRPDGSTIDLLARP